MADHTPGPWAVHPVKAQIDAFPAGAVVPVCSLLWPTELRSEDETEANAYLIAAAPDLLAALKLILASHDASCKGERCAIVGIDLARAALAKAEGTTAHVG